MRWLAFSLAVTLLGVVPRSVVDGALVVDHNNTNMMALSEEAIHLAKSNLHIAYGHTSHGSQLTSGMSGLVQFANNGGLGLSLPEDIFAWNNGGTDGALDLEEGDGYGNGWLDHDAGYYPNWITRRAMPHGRSGRRLLPLTRSPHWATSIWMVKSTVWTSILSSMSSSAAPTSPRPT